MNENSEPPPVKLKADIISTDFTLACDAVVPSRFLTSTLLPSVLVSRSGATKPMLDVSKPVALTMLALVDSSAPLSAIPYRLLTRSI